MVNASKELPQDTHLPSGISLCYVRPVLFTFLAQVQELSRANMNCALTNVATRTRTWNAIGPPRGSGAIIACRPAKELINFWRILHLQTSCIMHPLIEIPNSLDDIVKLLEITKFMTISVLNYTYT